MNKEIKAEDFLKTQITGVIFTALGVIVALAWNDAIRYTFDTIRPDDQSLQILWKYTYAVIALILFIIATVVVYRALYHKKTST